MAFLFWWCFTGILGAVCWEWTAAFHSKDLEEQALFKSQSAKHATYAVCIAFGFLMVIVILPVIYAQLTGDFSVFEEDEEG